MTQKEIREVYVTNKGRVYSISEMSDRQEKKWKKEIEGRFKVARDNLLRITLHKSGKDWNNLTPINKKKIYCI